MTVLERLDAFRELIRHGNLLLGEVIAYCRDAEAVITQLAAEKQDFDRLRNEIEDAKARADREAQAAQVALGQVESQRRELVAMRTELLKARGELDEFERSQSAGAEKLERSLAEARQQQTQLEQELERVRTQAASTRAIDARLVQIEQMESKLRVTERELADTRRALEDERSRRDRAIALIKPRSVTAPSGQPA